MSLPGSLKAKETLLSLADELQTLLLMMLPLAASYLSSLTMIITDVIIAGRMGSLELAAVSLVANLLSDFILICTGIVSIVGVLVGHAYGANNHRAIGQSVCQGLWVAAALSLLGMVLFQYLQPLLTLSGQDQAVIQGAEAYLNSAIWSLLPILGFAVLRSFVTALLHPAPIILITIAAAGLNLTLNCVLGFGLLGFPALGVEGIGYSTSLVSWMMMISLLVYIVRSQPLRPYPIFQGLGKLKLSVCGQIFKIGLPVAGMIILETGMFSAISILMGRLSAEDLAANQIVLTVVDTVTVIAFAIGEAATIRVAQGRGMGNPRLPYQTSCMALVLGGLLMMGMASLMWSMPQTIVSLFLDVHDPANHQVLKLATNLLGIAAIFQIFDGTQAITTRILKGFQDTVVSMWIGTIGYWFIAVTGGYILGFQLKMGGAGLWWGLAGGLAITAILLLWRFYTRSVRNITLARG